MKLSDLQRIEQAKRRRRAPKPDAPELPGIRASGLVRKMTEEERKQWFEKLRKDSGVE